MAALKLVLVPRKTEAFIWAAMPVLLILMLLLLSSLLHSSHARFEDASMAIKDVEETNYEDSTNFTNDNNTIVEDSAREVPTGPDPLHHNDNPTIVP